MTTGTKLFFRKMQLIGILRRMRIVTCLAFLARDRLVYGSLRHLRFEVGMALEAQITGIRFQQCRVP